MPSSSPGSPDRIQKFPGPATGATPGNLQTVRAAPGPGPRTRTPRHRVTGDESNRLTDQGEKAIASSAAEYGSADYHQAFAASLAGTASENQVQGRLAAARSEATHPSTAPTQGKGQPRHERPVEGPAQLRNAPRAVQAARTAELQRIFSQVRAKARNGESDFSVAG